MNILNVGYDSANYYLLQEGRTRLLIDVGWPGTLAKLLASLRRMDVDPDSLSYVLATHYHPDHAGLIQELKNRGVKHLVFQQQLAAIPLLKTYVKRVSGYVDIQIEDSLCLSTEDSRAWFERAGIAGEVVHTPGHSDDSISLVLDSGIAFTGDLLPVSLVGTEGAEATKNSWGALRALNVRTAYPGHGPARSLP